MAKSLIGMLGITAYKIPEVNNPPPRRIPMGCPFLDARSPEEARNVLREGMTDWHASDPAWKELIDKVLIPVGGPLPPITEASGSKA